MVDPNGGIRESYLFTDDDGNRRVGGKPTAQETAIAEARDGLTDEWNPDLESWDEFDRRTR